jgi:hypothetical protein
VVNIALGGGQLILSVLQSGAGVVDVVALSRGKLSYHSQVSGVSQNVHMDLAVPQSELMVRATMVRGNTNVAKAVQHVPKQGRKTGVVQPITTEPSISSEGGVGVVVHLSKIREKQINISSIEQRQQTKTPNKP